MIACPECRSVDVSIDADVIPLVQCGCCGFRTFLTTPSSAHLVAWNGEQDALVAVDIAPARKLPALALIDRVPDGCPPHDPDACELRDALPEWAPWTVEASPLEAMYARQPSVEEAHERNKGGAR